MEGNIFTYQSYIKHSVGTRFNFYGDNRSQEIPYCKVDYNSKTLSVYPTFAEKSYEIYDCIYCGKRLLSESKDYHIVENAGIPKGSTSIDRHRYGRRCQSCNWWFIVDLYSEDDDVSDSDYIDKTTFEGTICKFPYSTWEKPLSSMEEEMKKYRKRLSEFSPPQIEKLIGEILAQYMNCEVHAIGRSHDRGIDLVLIKGDTMTAVQVKHRSERRKQKSESVAPVRDFVGALIGEEFKEGIFFTTADKFSRDAEEYAERVVRNHIPLSLYTVKEIREFIGNIVVDQWARYDTLMMSDIKIREVE